MELDVTFLGLIVHNLRTRPLRSSLTAAAVAVGITTVLALGVLTYSLRETAVAIVRTGKADFTVAQEGVSDVLYSAIDESELAKIRGTPGVESLVGVLIGFTDYDAEHPLLIQLGLDPDSQREYGVRVVKGRSYGANANDEVMLGYRLASGLGLGVGDTLDLGGGDRFTVVGLYATGNEIGDSGTMFPLHKLQAMKKKTGIVTLAFVRTTPGADFGVVRDRIEREQPQLATVRSEQDFGRIDRNLILIQAANTGGTILALGVGIAGVMITSLLSFYERIREFGLLRAVGWSRRRLLGLVFGEALVLSLTGAAFGVVLGTLVVRALERVRELRGVFDPHFTAAIFGRSLYFAVAVAFLGALYPALRAAALVPLAALRRE
jgi:putative ABC transport system permease protein